MIRLGWFVVGAIALLLGGCAVYGAAETTTVHIQGDQTRVTADRWEGAVACGPGTGQSPCSASSVREGIR
ncbi:hypothetical protein [Microvirga puerhi]|uniref:Uncharacterized protein n=1 Tax=Microvirga puerhi TaxID=2876078 RepID=A0ABS7VQL1_9HYPH|nr:hypothetical protein [Microvirga puerhi]MBZ6077848.1 hypothetical protein [Microvirga puerhi]